MSANQGKFKKSIDGIFTVFANLKNQKTGEVEKPLKTALFNVAVLICVATIVGVFLVLGPFLRPLLWAFLFGAVLFPAKKKLSTAINSWILAIEKNDTPIALSIVIFPFNRVLKLGEFFTRWLLKHFKVLFIGLSCIVFVQLTIRYAPSELCNGIANIALWSRALFEKLVGTVNTTLFISILVTYAIAVALLYNSSSSIAFSLLGQTIWIFVVAYLSSFLGSLQTPVFVCCIIYGIVGYALDETNDGIHLFGKVKKLVNTESLITASNVEQEPSSADSESSPPPPPPPPPQMGRLLKTRHHLSEIKQKMQLSLRHEEKETETETEKSFMKPKEKELESNTYFKGLFYACGATVAWNHSWLLLLCSIPVLSYAVKQTLTVFGLWSYLEDKWNNDYSTVIDAWLKPRRSALVPFWLPSLVRLNLKVHKFFCAKLKSFVDDISAIVMIVVLVFGVISLGVFFFFQIYSETIAVATLGSNLINRTLTHRPELVEMLPINMQTMNDVIDNLYKYSRGTIEDYIDNVFNQTNPEQAQKLKDQILSVWDRLIQSYMDRNNEGVGPRVPSESVLRTIDEIFSTTGLTFSGIFAWAKQNLGVLMEISDSLWIVLKANISILFSTFTTLFSVLLGGGHAMIKFLFNTIIFFTTLYYLLQSSGDRYAPIALNINTAWGSRLGDALEDTVAGVLVATLKISLFHGLFTWLTHTLVGAHVVYLPSILATILAAAPFLETYWCCIPAFLDLWLSQDKFYLGLFLVLIHFIIPSNFNPIIHSEIKGGGHSYLTALSIIGGLYLFGGIEGAVLGPLLLCLLLLFSSMTVNNLHSSTPSTLTHHSSIEESNPFNSPATPQLDWGDRHHDTSI